MDNKVEAVAEKNAKRENNKPAGQSSGKAAKYDGRHPLFHIKYFPMDMARFVFYICMIGYRIKRHYLNEEAEKKCKWIKGGAVIVANHTAFDDPLYLNSLLWYRRNYYLAGEAVMDQAIKGPLLKSAGCIRIDRNISDINAIRECVRVLKEGFTLNMFPEGGIHKDGDVAEIKKGAILIAVQAGVPIIPVYSEPRKNWIHRRRAVIGEPFDPKKYCAKKFPSMAELNQMNEELLTLIHACEDKYKEVVSEKQ